MAAVTLWPAEGLTVLDANGDTITTAGIIVPTFTTYYRDLVRSGHLLTYDPLDLDSEPVTVGEAHGNVVGPASATDNAIARYNLATGRLIQNSLVTISDGGSISLPALATVDGRDISVDGAALDALVSGGGAIVSRLSSTLAANPGTTDGQAVVISGRSAIGDGAEGVAIWRAASTTTADNGTVWGSGTGRWHRVGAENFYNVKWFGAKGDGSTDDTAAIQAAINAAIVTVISPYTTMGLQVYFPAGQYNVTSSITFANVNGLHLRGATNGTVILYYSGSTNSTLDMISFDGVNCRFENLTLRTGGAKVRSAITCSSGSSGGWISSTNTFEDILIGGFLNDQFQYGFRFVYGSVGDNNNELHRFYRCHVTAYTDYAWQIYGSQTHGLWFESCQMNGNGATGYALGGVLCQYGSYIHWNGGSGGYHTVADFYFFDFFQHSSITGWNSENSARLCIAGNGSGAPFPLEISHCRFNSASVPADEEVIRLQTAGPAVVSCNAFDTTGPISELVAVANELRTDYIAHRANDTVHDVVGSSNTIETAACTDVATAITLLNEIRTEYAAHRVDLGPHDAADNTNTVASDACDSQLTAIVLARELKAAFNAHLSQAGVHPSNDATNVVTSSCNGRRSYIRNDTYSNTQNLTVIGNSFVADADYTHYYAQLVEDGSTFYRRGAIKGQNPTLWRILDGGNAYYEFDEEAIVHRTFPNHTGLRSITSTDVAGNTLGSTTTFSEGEATKTVTFAHLWLANDYGLALPEPDATYRVVTGIEIGSGSPTATIVRVANKSTTGFDLTIDTAPSAGQTIKVNWMIFRS